MNIPFNEMPSNARIWVYAANTKLDKQTQQAITNSGINFITTWTAHQQQLRAAFTILHDVFLVIAVDDNFNEVSGCGIDKSVHFMQEVEATYNLGLFNRMQIELSQNNEVIITNKQKLSVMMQEGTVNPQTNMFNKAIVTKNDFDSNFLIPLNKSWVFSAVQNG